MLREKRAMAIVKTYLPRAAFPSSRCQGVVAWQSPHGVGTRWEVRLRVAFWEVGGLGELLRSEKEIRA